MTLRPRLSASGPLLPSAAAPDLAAVLAVGGDAGGEAITGLPDPTTPSEPVTLGFLDARQAPIEAAWAAPVTLNAVTYTPITTFTIEEDGWYDVGQNFKLTNSAPNNGAPVLAIFAIEGPGLPILLGEKGFFPVGPGQASTGTYWIGGTFVLRTRMFLVAGDYTMTAVAAVSGGFADGAPIVYPGSPTEKLIISRC